MYTYKGFIIATSRHARQRHRQAGPHCVRIYNAGEAEKGDHISLGYATAYVFQTF